MPETETENQFIHNEPPESEGSMNYVELFNAARGIDACTGTDREHLSTPFDHPVEVDGRIMNVDVQGSGDKNVVLLPGRGVTAPSYDFAPLIAQLKDDS